MANYKHYHISHGDYYHHHAHAHAHTRPMMHTDRERVMELLLSQERVISLLYQKTYPGLVKTPSVTLPPVGNQERLSMGGTL